MATPIAPDPIIRAASRVLFVASYTTRNWALDEDTPRKQIYDLWEAIHPIPDLLCRWREGAEQELLRYLDEYDEKWPTREGHNARWPTLRLRSIYEHALNQPIP